MSIPDSPKKINIIAFIAILVVLGFFLAFGGLKLSHFLGQKQPIRVHYASAASAGQIAPDATEREYESKSSVLEGISGVEKDNADGKTSGLGRLE